MHTEGADLTKNQSFWEPGKDVLAYYIFFKTNITFEIHNNSFSGLNSEKLQILNTTNHLKNFSGLYFNQFSVLITGKA